MNDLTEPHQQNMTQSMHAWSVETALTIYNAADLKAQLLQALQQGAGLQIDLVSVDDIDTAGVQLLVLAQRECQRLGQPFEIVHPSESVLDVLRMYRLEDSLGLHDPSQPMPDSEPHILEVAHE